MSNQLIPQSEHLRLLSEAIDCTNPDAARLLMRRAMSAIYPHRTWQIDPWNDSDLDAVLALVQGIKPRDTVEAILASQFVALHLQATANMAQENYNIMPYALTMLRLSHQTLDMLQRYRGKSQTINVNYNMLNNGNTVVNTVVQEGSNKKG
jgi:hypothetical protein